MRGEPGGHGGHEQPRRLHHLRQLKDSSLIISRRIRIGGLLPGGGLTQVAGLLHQVIGRTVVTCPGGRRCLTRRICLLWTPTPGARAAGLTPQQRSAIHQVHDLLTENLDSRITIEQLSRHFLA